MSTHLFNQFANRAWMEANLQNPKAALLNYELADDFVGAMTDEDGVNLNPSLSVLRHCVGKGEGQVVPVTVTEDTVVSFYLRHPKFDQPESPYIDGMTLLDPSIETLEKNIRIFMDGVNLGHHPKNIEDHKSHVMVLSTGRCGTVSLFHLLKESNLFPYHTYWWNLPSQARRNMSCQFASGDFRDSFIPDAWFTTRSAEWLGGTMIGLNHMDTIFAPAFAAMHPKSKFVYLSRSPVDFFKSSYGKNQFGNAQLMPMYYTFKPEFMWAKSTDSIPKMIAWWIKFTENFSRAFGRVIGERYIEISADKLFSRDESEIKRLLDFIGSDVSVEKAVEHYGTKINEKKHKNVVPLEPGLTEFRKAFQ